MKPTVLVVDDEWAVTKLLRHTFSLAGFEVLTAANEQEFWERAQAKRPDAIILDIMLGNKYGTQIYQNFLERGLDRNIPVVFISALAKDRPPAHPRPGRTYALIGKPFDPDELVKQIQELLTHQV